MKRIKLLHAAIYLVLAFVIYRDALPDLRQGFADGYRDGVETRSGRAPKLIRVQATLSGNVFQIQNNRVDSSVYKLQQMNVSATVFVKNPPFDIPGWLTAINMIIVLTMVFLLVAIIYSIEKIVRTISNNATFTTTAVNLLKMTGLYLFIYFIIDYIFQEISYMQQTMWIKYPLVVINTSTFNLEILICAILALILAEAFKQGIVLKEEQALTI